MTLRTHNINVTIANQTICRDLNLTINPGMIYGILGPNGSGKTTLLQTLAKLHPVQAGDIFLFEKNLTTLSAKQIAQQLGILFQDTTAIFSQTVFEFCLNGRHPHLARLAWENISDHEMAIAALTTVELDKKLLQKVHTLSGGERRRLAIAALLTQAPHIYLLDEPMNHLDIYHQMLVLSHFKHLAHTQSTAIIMSLHDVNIAQHFCQQIILLLGNGATIQGTPDEMLTEKNLSQLYHYPLKKRFLDSHSFWLPDY
jgi:iron complex transport system ATP-binding protein